MATKRLRPVHPGDILVRDLMEPLGLNSHELARRLGVSVLTANEIVRRRRAVTAEMSLRLARFFGTSARLWQNLQSQYDLEIASQKIGRKIVRTVEPLARPDLVERSDRDHRSPCSPRHGDWSDEMRSKKRLRRAN